MKSIDSLADEVIDLVLDRVTRSRVASDENIWYTSGKQGHRECENDSYYDGNSGIAYFLFRCGKLDSLSYGEGELKSLTELGTLVGEKYADKEIHFAGLGSPVPAISRINSTVEWSKYDIRNATYDFEAGYASCEPVLIMRAEEYLGLDIEGVKDMNFAHGLGGYAYGLAKLTIARIPRAAERLEAVMAKIDAACDPGRGYKDHRHDQYSNSWCHGNAGQFILRAYLRSKDIPVSHSVFETTRAAALDSLGTGFKPCCSSILSLFVDNFDGTCTRVTDALYDGILNYCEEEKDLSLFQGITGLAVACLDVREHRGALSML